MKIVTKYFFLAIVFVGTLGIWLPILLDILRGLDFNFNNISPRMTTYFTSILFAGCIDYFLKILDTDNSNLKSSFLNVVIIFIFTLILSSTCILTYSFNFFITSFILSIIGLVFSWILWWKVNLENSKFYVPNDSLGGDTSKQLSNN